MEPAVADMKDKTIIWHGSYGMRTRFDIEQHRYGCTDCEDDIQGYQELLEIRDPPDARQSFVIHLFRHDVGARIWEFATLADAQAGWEALRPLWWYLGNEGYLPRLPTCVHVDFLGM